MLTLTYLPVHGVEMPKNPKRLKTDQANNAMRQMGYEPQGNPEYDLKAKKTFQTFKAPSGKTVRMSSDQIKDAVYMRSVVQQNLEII